MNINEEMNKIGNADLRNVGSRINYSIHNEERTEQRSKSPPKVEEYSLEEFSHNENFFACEHKTHGLHDKCVKTTKTKW